MIVQPPLPPLFKFLVNVAEAILMVGGFKWMEERKKKRKERKSQKGK